MGRAGSPVAEYRTFLDFDLSSLAASGSKIIRAQLVLHPLLAASGARLTHYACLLKDAGWHADELTWQNMPDSQCGVDHAQPCCGEVVGSWEPKASKAVQVDVTYYAKQALERGGSKLMSMQLYAPTAASSREHYYVQYGGSRRGDASTRPELLLDVLAQTSSVESKVVGGGLGSARAGAPASFKIVAHDEDGTPQVLGGDGFKARLATEDGVEVNATVIDVDNGEYAVSYTPIVAGAYKLFVNLRGAAVGQPHYLVNVEPGPASPAHCVASGQGLIEASAGVKSFFDLTPKDSYGNTRHAGLDAGDKFTVNIARRGGGGAALEWQSAAAITNLENGTYRVEYLVQRAGPYLMQVQLGGVNIMGAPFQAVVLPGRTDAHQSKANGDGLKVSVAGVPASFVIVAADAFGNERSVCGDNFQVALSGPARGRSRTRVHGLVSESANGTYIVEYTVTIAGLYEIKVSLGDTQIVGSPFSMQALPAETRASHSVAFGRNASLTHAVAGEQTEFYVLAKDTFGNQEHASAAGDFNVTLHGPGGLRAPAAVRDQLDGMYAISYTPTVAGVYSIDVLFNQLHVYGSPYTTLVSPGKAHPPHSLVLCADGAPCATKLGVAGELQHFQVRARDVHKNPCRRGGAGVAALLAVAKARKAITMVAGGGGGGVMAVAEKRDGGAAHPVEVLDTADGLYTVQYRINEAGTYLLSVTMDGAHIDGSPFTTVIEPGPTCATRTTAATDQLHVAIAGELTRVKLHAADCYGNKQTRGGDLFAVTLTRAPDKVVGSFVDNGDGTYWATYNLTTRGQWGLHIKSSGVHIEGSPFNVMTLPGATDPAASFATGPGLTKAYTGEPTTFLVRTKDANGNDKATGGDFVAATLTQVGSGEVVHANVTDTGEGSYSIRYTLLVTNGEDYNLNVHVNSGSLPGSPYAVKAVAGPMACTETLSIEQPKCVVGTIAEAPIYAKDKYGNQRDSGGDVFGASLQLLEPPYGNETIQVGDNGDGTYKAMWVVSRAGKYKLWVSGHCGAIKDAPFEVHCMPAALSFTHSLLAGEGAADAVAGSVTKFAVHGRDVFDNALVQGQYRWAASLCSPAATYAVQQVEASADDGDAYSFAFNVTRAGTYDLMVGAPNADGSVNGSVQVRGSPSTLIVRPGPLSGPASKVFGPNCPEGEGVGAADRWCEGAGRPVRLWIEARDAFGNAHEVAMSPPPFAIALTKKGDPREILATVTPANRGGSGAYTADFTVADTGDYLVSVKGTPPVGISGVEGPLDGSPYLLSIQPGATSVFHSTAGGPGISGSSVGRLMWVSITARDMYGNPRTQGGDRFALALDGPNGTKLTASSIVDYGNGTYNATYLATVAGNYSLYVQRADTTGVFWDIRGSPFPVAVSTGPTNPFVSRLVGRHEVVAGEEAAFTLMTRDEFGNAPAGGEVSKFAVEAVHAKKGVAQAMAKLLDAGRGNYTVLHQFTDGGEYVLRAAMVGSGGGAMPDFPLKVLPGPLSPPHCELLWPCYAPECKESDRHRAGYYVNWPVRFAVVPFDGFGNRRADAGKSTTFVARIQGPKQAAASAQLRCAGETALADTGTNAVHCKAVQRGDGLFVVEFVPAVRGAYLVNVTARVGSYGGKKLGNLPGSVVVQVDSAPVATCTGLRNCSGHGQCNYQSGRCICDAGWDGMDCGQGATKKRACLNDCSGHGYCSDVVDAAGQNQCRCAADYGGADCSTWKATIMLAAAAGGPTCANDCSGQGACNLATGECACYPGWGGDDCSLGGDHTLTEIATDANGRTQLLDFEPATRRFSVRTVRKTVGDSGALECAGLEPQPVCSGRWPVVADPQPGAWRQPFVFANLGAGMLMQYEPTTGAYLLLHCDGGCEGGVPCSRQLAQGQCSEQQLPLGPSMRASFLGKDTVLFHNGATGAYTMHRLNRNFLEDSGCMFEMPLAAGAWSETGTHRHVWMGRDMLLDYKPSQGHYTFWQLHRGAQGEENPLVREVTAGSFMTTARAFSYLGAGLLLVLDSGAAGGYQFWQCSETDADFQAGHALPCHPAGQADGLSKQPSCPSGCSAGDCSCGSKAACVSQAGCGWCGDASPGQCAAGGVDGPVAGGATSECFAWHYGESAMSNAGARKHSYSYLQGGQLLDYSADDGAYSVWRLAKPPRPGCPAVAWPPEAKGTLATTKHELAVLPPPHANAVTLMDYDPTRGDYRLGHCNRTETSLSAHLACRTTANGTWHAGGLQLLWVGQRTLLRYAKATGEYSLWRFNSALDASPFEEAPVSEGTLLRADGKRLRDATLSYLDMGELLAHVPSSGYVALFRRTDPQVESGADAFARRWEAFSPHRDWEFVYTGGEMVMMLKPGSGAYRVLNCSAVYADQLPADAGANALGLPCAVMQDGALPEAATCAYEKDSCLMAPHCGWCESSRSCVAANEDGVCFGSCADGQLLYGSSAPSSASLMQQVPCSSMLSCERCAEREQCGWCTSGGGQCLQASAMAEGSCADGRFLQYDGALCESATAGLVSQAR